MRKINYEKIKAENDEKLRHKLFQKTLAATIATRNAKSNPQNRQAELLKNRADKTTEMLNSLVLRMNEQVKHSEETTATLIHSSSVIKETHTHSNAISATIRSGGKLISKYARRETTDKILVVLALILYFGVCVYILRKRIPWFNFFWILNFVKY